MPDPTSIRTLQRRQIFLETLAETAIFAEACRRAGAARNSFYAWRRDDPAFAADWDRALKQGMATLEDAAILRAGGGGPLSAPRGGGEPVAHYSDRLLMCLLKAHNPARYCARTRAAAIARRISGDG